MAGGSGAGTGAWAPGSGGGVGAWAPRAPVVVKQIAQPTTTTPAAPKAPASPTSSTQPASTTTSPGGSAGAAQATPYDAAYQEQLAALQHQYENTLGNDQFTRETAENAAHQRQGGLDRQLPLSLAQTRDRANQRGIAESGIAAEMNGSVEAKYVEQRNALDQQLQAAAGRQSIGDLNAASLLRTKIADAGVSAIERNLKEDERFGVNETPPAQPPQVAAGIPPGPQVVKQTAQPTKTSTRRAASNNYLAKLKAKGRF